MAATASIFFKTKPNANKLFCVPSTNSTNLLGSMAAQVIHHHPQLLGNVQRLFSFIIMTLIHWQRGLREGGVGGGEKVSSQVFSSAKMLHRAYT